MIMIKTTLTVLCLFVLTAAPIGARAGVFNPETFT